MSDLGPSLPFSLRDLAWRTAFRLGFPLARIWWSLSRREHQGALVAVHVGGALLLLRSSYRAAWNFPGGSIRRGEAPEAAARRELVEEIGLVATSLRPAGTASGIWDGRPDTVHFFELAFDIPPRLRLDNREIIGARLFPVGEVDRLDVTGPVAIYLGRLRTNPASPGTTAPRPR